MRWQGLLARLAGALIVPAFALAAGALAALAHPPFGFWPGLIGFAGLLAIVDGTQGKGRLWRAFGAGWLAGFAYFLIGCWWVAEAFMVDAEHQAWMAPFAATLLPAGLALFWGAACALYRRIAPSHLGRVAVFAAIFSLFEWLRGHLLTGFPWNLPGEAWKAGSAPSQVAAYVGAYGLTFLTVFAFTAFAPLMGEGVRKRRIGMAVAGALVIAGLWVVGVARIPGRGLHPTSIVVRIVQPDIAQESKWTPDSFADIVHRYLNLTSRANDKDPQIIVWPEGALPAPANEVLDPAHWVEPALEAALKPGQLLLMGSYRAQPGQGGDRYYNSLYAIRRTATGLKVEAVYDKHRLVPFGEYLPLESLLTPLGVKNLAHLGEGFSSGPKPAPMRLSGFPTAQPLICYEGLFPELAGNGATRPAWIVNVSNDAWFGPTSGPLQHLNLASYRAIEQGLPIIRATPTGVSAVVDPWGRVVYGERLNPHESGVIDAYLPAPTAQPLYSLVGDLLFWVMIVLGLALAAPLRRFSETLAGTSRGNEVTSQPIS